MITNAEIRDALAVMIKNRAELNLEVYYNQVVDAANDYAWIQLTPERTDRGYDYFVRRVQVDINVVLAPKTGIVKHTDLLNVADALDAATHGYTKIKDRAVTIYDTHAHIFDDILHYEFKLEFCDTIASLPEELEEYNYGNELKTDWRI